jgi:addiction module toxin, txe/yoeB family
MGNIEEKDEEKEKLYGIEISKEAKKELDLIKKSGTPSVKKKLERIIEELQKHPTEGVGIEQLKGKGGIG